MIYNCPVNFINREKQLHISGPQWLGDLNNLHSHLSCWSTAISPGEWHSGGKKTEATLVWNWKQANERCRRATGRAAVTARLFHVPGSCFHLIKQHRIMLFTAAATTTVWKFWAKCRCLISYRLKRTHLQCWKESIKKQILEEVCNETCRYCLHSMGLKINKNYIFIVKHVLGKVAFVEIYGKPVIRPLSVWPV